MTDYAETIPVDQRVASSVVASLGTPRVLTPEETEALLEKDIEFFDKPGDKLRALALLILAENNLQAQKINAILEAGETATSLADFKTKMTAITDAPTRTPQQLRGAIKTLLDRFV